MPGTGQASHQPCIQGPHTSQGAQSDRLKARQQYRINLKNGQHKGITLKINYIGHNQQKHPEDRGISYRLLNIYLTSHNAPFTSLKYASTDKLAVDQLSAKYPPDIRHPGECPRITAAMTDNCGEQKT